MGSQVCKARSLWAPPHMCTHTQISMKFRGLLAHGRNTLPLQRVPGRNPQDIHCSGGAFITIICFHTVEHGLPSFRHVSTAYSAGSAWPASSSPSISGPLVAQKAPSRALCQAYYGVTAPSYFSLISLHSKRRLASATTLVQPAHQTFGSQYSDEETVAQRNSLLVQSHSWVGQKWGRKAVSPIN